MPELPEVEALVQDLRGRLTGRAITRIDLAAFSALKTFDPPLHSLHGTLVDDVTRHGKFLDINASRACTCASTSRAPAGSAGARRCRRCPPGPTARTRSPPAS